MKQATVLFLGTPEFGIAVLERLVVSPALKAAGISVCAAVTAPDKPAGRKLALKPSPVKEAARRLGVRVVESDDLRSPAEHAELSSLAPDIILMAAFGQILPQSVLSIPKKGALGLHPSLLPRWRGATPIQAAILHGDTITGTTLFLMDEKLDHGMVVDAKQTELAADETSETLHQKLSLASAQLVEEALPRWLSGELTARPQDETSATFTRMLKKEDGRLDWGKDALELERQVRAYLLWPGSWFEYGEDGARMRVKVFKAHVAENVLERRGAGMVFATPRHFPAVATSNGELVFEEVQPEGKPRMSAEAFLRGRPDLIGQKLV